MTGQGGSLYELAPTYLRSRYRILFYTVLLSLVSKTLLTTAGVVRDTLFTRLDPQAVAALMHT